MILLLSDLLFPIRFPTLYLREETMKRFLVLMMMVLGVQAVNLKTSASEVDASASDPQKEVFYVGTYGQGEEGGIRRYSLNTADGTVELLGVTPGVDSPSFLAIDKKGEHLYTVMLDAAKQDKVAAFAIDPKTSELKLLNSQPARGVHPCHVILDVDNTHAITANYVGGSVSVFPIAKDGSLRAASDVVQHTVSSGVDPGRQKEPHPHMVNVSPEGGFVYVPDLGADYVKIYQLVDDKLKPATQPEASTKSGAGPRHCVFHPEKPWFYVINELNSTIECFRHNPKTGELDVFQAISTLPESYKEKSYCADIHIDPTGRFLYGSNRGHNSIAIFSIDPASGKLTAIGHQSTGGDWPRNFAIDPSGKFLLVANRRTNDIHTFKIEKDGMLTPVGKPVQMPQPVCIKFLKR